MKVALLCLAIHWWTLEVRAQYCYNTCPPLNDIGVPQDSLCEGNVTAFEDTEKSFNSCYGNIPSFKLSDFKGKGRVTVISNYYFGCNAGRRESGVFAHIAQRLYDAYPERVMFIASNKGASCNTWSDIMAEDALVYYPGSAKPVDMPVVMDDTDSVLRDLLFTPPFGHPSYVVFDGELRVRHKFVGPCCGKSGYYDCKVEEAKSLNDELSGYVEAILEEDTDTYEPEPTSSPISFVPTPTGVGSCDYEDWSEWSGCSITCGSAGSGTEFRWRIVIEKDPEEPCESFVQTRSCSPQTNECANVCIPETGRDYEIRVIAEGFDGPRDIAFHPTPGYHLGKYSEGRTFLTENVGDGEAWVLNGNNHSISIVSAVGSDLQTTLSRRDRGYYHYMINATALSFNAVGDSGRNRDRDSFNYWAVCNDNRNTYLDRKEPNYFMGPTLYDSFGGDFNIVNEQGKACKKYEKCFFLHADMLHESPACIGIAHDPEVNTAYGNVYWAFDATGNQENGQLVRFDFQQPHGPRSMDHSIAAVRRYPQVQLHRGDPGVHAGMVVHPARREVFIANPGRGTILLVRADTGSFARIAREEYPIYSNTLPSFDYSIWECAEQRIFSSGLETPTGVALSNDGERLYVAEHLSGKILVYEISSGTILNTIETGATSIEGMAISRNTDTLYFVDSTKNSLNAVIMKKPCKDAYTTRLSEEYSKAVKDANEQFEEKVGPDIFSVYYDAECTVKTVVPNVTYFDQVHTDTGYASNDTDVQGPAGMDPDAYLLANRTDCGYSDELNFDALLLGGFYCHTCLPITNGSMCDNGGTCQNVQWEGYTCDNQFRVNTNAMKLYNSSNVRIEAKSVKLDPDVTYRFYVSGKKKAYLSRYPGKKRALSFPGNKCGCAKRGSLVFSPADLFADLNKKPFVVFLRTSGKRKVKLIINYNCEDTGIAYGGDKEKDCNWVKNDPDRLANLCGKRINVQNKCAKTCGICE